MMRPMTIGRMEMALMGRSPARTWLSLLVGCTLFGSGQVAAAEGAASRSQFEGANPGLVVMQPRVTGIPADQVDPAALTNLASSLIAGLDRYRVISHQDVVAVLDKEAQAQLAGCDETTCMAEVGNALGAPFLFYATVGRAGSRYVVTTTLIENASARVVQRQAITVASADSVLDALRVATLRTFGEQAELPRQAAGINWVPFGIASLAVGVAVMAAGGVGTGLALYWNASAKTATQMQEFNNLRNQIAIANPLAITGYVVGALFVLAAPVFFLLPSGEAIEAGEHTPQPEAAR
jgi:hypothetical protein